MNKAQNALHELAKKKYLSNIEGLINLKDRKNQAYLSLAFTFAALSLSGIFAINPTISTILSLQKELEDDKVLLSQMKTKIGNLLSLQQAYNVISSDLPIVSAAMPEKPGSPYLFGQIQQMAQDSNVNISSLQHETVSLTQVDPNVTLTYPFTLTVEGTYSDLMSFLASFSRFDRLVTLSAVAIANKTETNQSSSAKPVSGDTREMTITAKTYYRL